MELPTGPMIHLNPADRQFPLKDGAEVYRVTAGAREPDGEHNPEFRFEIAFGEGEEIQGDPIVPTLDQFVQFTRDAIELFGKEVFWDQQQRNER